MDMEVNDAPLKGIEGAMTKAAAVGNLVADAAEKAASAVIDVGKQAVDAFASFEQLQGGVEKLYGDASEKVLDYANKAYESVQMSANEYLENATSMAGALRRSLGDDADALAEYTDKAMRQIADNASVFGSDLESIERAYSGFARGQFLMLDNLKLGYAGTKEGMKELLADAEKISGVHYDMDSYSDIIDAIQIIQDQMNITGNAAKEAMHTIEGAGNATKAAWENLMSSLLQGDESKIEEAVNNLWDSASNYIKLLAPKVETAILQLGDLVQEKGPEIAEKLWEGIQEKWSEIDFGQLKDDIMQALTDGISEGIPEGADLGKAILDKIVDAIPEVSEKAADMATEFLDSLNSAFDQGFSDLENQIMEYFSDPSAVEADMEAFGEAIWAFIIAGLRIGISSGNLMNTIRDGFITSTSVAIAGYFSYLGTELGKIKDIIGTAVSDGIAHFEEKWNELLNKGQQAANNFIDKITSPLGKLGQKIGDKVKQAVDKVKTYISSFENVGRELGEALLHAILAAIAPLVDEIVKTIQKAISAAKSIKSNASPRRSGLDYVPSDGYLTALHRGEMVLTAAEAERYRNGGRTEEERAANVVNNYTINVPDNRNAYNTAVELRRIIRNEEVARA